MSLQTELNSLTVELIRLLPEELRQKIAEENKKLFASFLRDMAIKDGDKVPDVIFRDKHLKPVHLRDLLKDSNIVLSFFRGTWCPYCNLELTALARINNQIEAKGARLVAVSPELYKYSADALQRDNVNYTVLTDLSNKAAEKFGIAFDLPPEYQEIYKKSNIHLDITHGENKWTLPVPATFIISKSEKIVSSYINPDYTKRMEPDDILKHLDQM